MYQAGDFLKRKAIWVTVKIAFLSVLLMLCAFLLHGMGQRLQRDTQAVAETPGAPIIIIDPGHGGEDGGAVGINGCVEKELNLEISLILNDLLRFSGIETVMTRQEDVLLYDNAAPGKKKSQDLKNRLDIAESYENGITVSIHMNSYPVSRYSGAQIYYSPNHPESKLIAEGIQSKIISCIQPENEREIKSATSAIYLLNKATKPCVLVECGFISNPEEADLLSNDSYRHRMAMTIYTAIIEYLHKEV